MYAGIRFVYFSAENELQSKAFAEEVGLETGWNCFISLNDDAIVRYRSVCWANTDVTDACLQDAEYILNYANLPSGVSNIRQHLEVPTRMSISASIQ